MTTAASSNDHDYARALDAPEQLLGFRLETVLAHLAVYAGVARAFDGYAIAAQVFAERADVDGPH